MTGFVTAAAIDACVNFDGAQISSKRLRCFAHCLFDAKIIESQICGYVRLIMTSVVRPCLGDIIPVGKSLSPPSIIFGNGMKLRQVKRNQADIVEAVYLTLPFFRKLLLIAENAIDLEILGNIIRGNTQMMDDDGLRIVHHT